MKSRLIFLDIDGTLTPPGTNIPPQSAITTIRNTRKNGHKVCLCSGRNIPMLRPLLDHYTFDGFVGGSGAIVGVGDKLLYDCPMDREDTELAMNLLRGNQVYCSIESKEGAWCDPGMGEFLARQNGGNSELLRWRKALEHDLGIRPFSEYPGCPAYKIVFMCESEEQLAPAREALEYKYTFLIQDGNNGSRYVNGEINNRIYNKGTGIRLIADALGYNLADTIGFGDSMNDLEMAETVGYSVCMGNGSPKLQDISDYVCPPIEEDGLAIAFEKLGLVS